MDLQVNICDNETILIGIVMKGKELDLTEKSIMGVSVGSIFATGRTILVSGIYRFTYHVEDIPCLANHSGNRFLLTKGDLFPRHKSCDRKVYWRLEKVIENS